jgi:hypothetical protein
MTYALTMLDCKSSNSFSDRFIFAFEKFMSETVFIGIR